MVNKKGFNKSRVAATTKTRSYTILKPLKQRPRFPPFFPVIKTKFKFEKKIDSRVTLQILQVISI